MIAEGPIRVGKKKSSLNHLLLFTDLLICVVKDEDAPFPYQLQWKVDLLKSEIELQISDDDQQTKYLRVVTTKKISVFPYTVNETYDLYEANNDRSYTIDRWKSHFDDAQKIKSNYYYLFENSNVVSKFVFFHPSSVMHKERGEILYIYIKIY